jgi:hypothetical protein
MMLSPGSEVVLVLLILKWSTTSAGFLSKMRTKLERGEAPRSTERHQEVSSRQNTHNPPSTASKLSDAEQEPEIFSEETNTIPSAGEERPDKWIKGIPLIMVTSGVTLVIFLMLLDMSILSTVSRSTLRVLMLSLIWNQ